MKDLYQEAIEYGTNIAAAHSDLNLPTAYWIARYAARETAAALLIEAHKIGVTDEQFEKLRAVAAEVAYD